jgi:NAD(P)-dependent dehydrogenase (short-subunit alcohol dehydrogenase family)
VILDKFSLEGKVAIVTGGGTGLGKAICLALARAGADVVPASRNYDNINQTATEVRELGRRAVAIPTDVTDSRQVNNLIARTIDEFGKIDILVNNAGIATGVEPSPRDAAGLDFPPIWEITDEMWRYAIDTNLSGAFYCCRAVIRHMIERNRGKIINMASAAGLRTVRNAVTYSSAKAGVIMLTKTLAVTFARNNIQVNCIAPSMLIVAEVPPEFLEERKRFSPSGRAGEAREIGPLAVYLASDASDYVNGECFVIDGAGIVGYAPTGYAPVIPLE